MCFHYLLADVALTVWIIFVTFFAQVVVSPCHLLHFHICSHRFLSINLTDKWLHALGHTLAYLCRHIWYHIDDFLLSLLCFIIWFDYILYIIVFSFIQSLQKFLIELLLSLHASQTLCHFFSDMAALNKYFITSEWINGKLVLKSDFTIFHLISNTLAYFRPFLMIFSISCFHRLVILLKVITLLLNNLKLLSQLDTLVLFFSHVLI